MKLIIRSPGDYVSKYVHCTMCKHYVNIKNERKFYCEQKQDQVSRGFIWSGYCHYVELKTNTKLI